MVSGLRLTPVAMSGREECWSRLPTHKEHEWHKLCIATKGRPPCPPAGRGACGSERGICRTYVSPNWHKDHRLVCSERHTMDFAAELPFLPHCFAFTRKPGR